MYSSVFSLVVQDQNENDGRVESSSLSDLCHPVSQTVENSPEADVRPWQLPHAAVHRAARSPYRCCPGAQLGHRSSAVAQTGPEVPQRVSVRGQCRRTRHPGSAKWAKSECTQMHGSLVHVHCQVFSLSRSSLTQITPMERPFDSTMDGSCEGYLLWVFFHLHHLFLTFLSYFSFFISSVICLSAPSVTIPSIF